MSNPHVVDRISPYLDGALPASDLGYVQAHLEVCGACERAYTALRTLRGMLRGLAQPAEQAGLAERIHWRLAREEAAQRASPWRAARAVLTQPLRVALAGAMVLIVIGLPMGWVSGVFAPRGTLFDADAYVRDYLLTSSDRLTDDVTRTVIVHTALPESTVQR